MLLSMSDAATELTTQATDLLRHDVVSPVTVAAHVLEAMVDDPSLAADTASRIGIVVGALRGAAGAAGRVASALTPPSPDTHHRATWRGLVAAAWDEVDVTDHATPPVHVEEGAPGDPVLLDVARVVAVLADLLTLAAHGGDPASIAVGVQPAVGGLRVRVTDAGPVPLARREHVLGSLCLTRAARIVGRDVVVEQDAQRLVTHVLLAPELVGGAHEDAGTHVDRR